MASQPLDGSAAAGNNTLTTPADSGSTSSSSTSESGAAGIKGLVRVSWTASASASADVKDVKSAPDGGSSGGSSGLSAAKVDRSKVTDVWRRQTEWRASQGVLSHKVTVAVECQNKKNWVYKCTFKPLPLLKTKDGAAVPATGKEKELPEVTVFRRYDDLVWLRSTIMKMFPGTSDTHSCLIPASSIDDRRSLTD